MGITSSTVQDHINICLKTDSATARKLIAKVLDPSNSAERGI